MIPGKSTQLNESLTFVHGDTWGGIPALSITISGTPPADDVASAKMQFRPTEVSSDTLVELSSSDATQLSITSANGWTFVVPAQQLDLPAGTYTWGFQTIDVNGIIQTYLEGTILVLPEAVYD